MRRQDSPLALKNLCAGEVQFSAHALCFNKHLFSMFWDSFLVKLAGKAELDLMRYAQDSGAAIFARCFFSSNARVEETCLERHGDLWRAEWQSLRSLTIKARRGEHTRAGFGCGTLSQALEGFWSNLKQNHLPVDMHKIPLQHSVPKILAGLEAMFRAEHMDGDEIQLGASPRLDFQCCRLLTGEAVLTERVACQNNEQLRVPAASAYVAGAPANFQLEKFALADDAVRFYTLPLRDASLTVDQKTHEAGVRTTETREGKRRKRRETRLRHERSWCSWSERSPSIRLGGCVRRTMIVVKEAWPDVSLLETSETWSQVKQALRSIGAWVEDENRLSMGQVRQLLHNVCICSALDHEVRCS